jgi:hypothetical protein
MWRDLRKQRRPSPAQRLVVYTAIFGDIPDQLKPPAKFKPDAGVAFVCFSDRKYLAENAAPWQVRPPLWSDPDPRRTARYHKILSHLAFADANYTLWLDGNIQLTTNPRDLVGRYLTDGVDVAAFKHRHRSCVYEELEACVRLDKDGVAVMRRQIEGYRKQGYPEQNGLAETGVLLRRHSPRVKEFNQAWWNEIEAGSVRDQLSFNFVMWNRKMSYGLLKGQPDRSPYVKYARHR